MDGRTLLFSVAANGEAADELSCSDVPHNRS